MAVYYLCSEIKWWWCFLDNIILQSLAALVLCLLVKYKLLCSSSMVGGGFTLIAWKTFSLIVCRHSHRQSGKYSSFLHETFGTQKVIFIWNLVKGRQSGLQICKAQKLSCPCMCMLLHMHNFSVSYQSSSIRYWPSQKSVLRLQVLSALEDMLCISPSAILFKTFAIFYFSCCFFFFLLMYSHFNMVVTWLIARNTSARKCILHKWKKCERSQVTSQHIKEKQVAN